MSGDAVSTLILGGGLAGVSTAYHLPKRNHLLVEREGELGGTARSFSVNGFTFDITGHLLHLHNNYTKKLIPRLLKNRVFTCQRNTWIFSHGTYTRYPFQAFTYGLPRRVVDECVLGFFERYLEQRPPEKRSKNFREWCFQVFGDGIARHFMIPYNEKLYQTRASNMTTDWCGPFVPTPDLSDVISGALRPGGRQFGYNATFLYPKTGGIQALASAMGESLSGIRLRVSVASVDWRRRRATLSDGTTVGYRRLVNTIPLPELLKRMAPLPPAIQKAAGQLKHASIICLNLGVRRAKISDASWIYFPEPEFPFYRVGFPMNFTPHVVPRGCSSMYVEIPADQMRKTGSERAILRDVRKGLERAGILRTSDTFAAVQFIPVRYAYVIYDEHRSAALRTIFRFLSGHGIQSIGRYGAWKYSFMEEAILDGKAAAERIVSGKA
ncbi:MAG: FAD-dependent oxidoreductase [Elusimicrobia bacterium]|nr:FAD-dependent oxidoreductase [Elusimicrobiota bacterium]